MPSQLPGESTCSKLLRALLILEIGTQSPDLQAAHAINTTIKGLEICAAGTHLRLSSSSKSLNFKYSGQVAYFYDADVATYYYGQHHPMKPHRIKMTHSLILNYGLYNMMECYKPLPATKDELATFHSTDYLDFLQTVTTENKDQFLGEMKRFCVGEDCPVFNDMYTFCQKYAGGSIGGAVKLNQQANDVCINWAGGLHHAKKAEASGFCYVNDIVLAILELLKYHARVLYVDIDIHHGDGVEEAFLTTDRVMTVSFHKYDGEFFPGTGRLNQIGHDRGRGYAMNIPLNDGIDDESYEQLFKPIMRKVVEVYKPEVIVFQSGADSLAGDKLGAFNLSMRGHAAALMSMKAFGIPMMVLGGGGYRISNVARCWAFETGQILGVEMDNQLPTDPWLHNYGPDFHLHIQSRTGKENQNTPERLGRLQQHVIENLKRIQAPSVPFHERAPDAMAVDDMHTTLPTAGDDGLPADDVESKQGRSRMDIDSNAEHTQRPAEPEEAVLKVELDEAKVKVKVELEEAQHQGEHRPAASSLMKDFS